MKKKTDFAFLAFILLLPLIPSVMGSTQIHVNILAVLSAVLSIFLRRINKNDILKASTIFILPQALLIGTIFISGEYSGIGGLMSAARPAMMFILLIFFLARMRRISSGDELDTYINRLWRLTAWLTLISFLVAVLEVVGVLNPLIELLYKRSDMSGIASHATTFFGQGYYSGFVAFTLLCIALPRYSVRGGFRSLAIILMLLSWATLSQSKPMIFACIMSIGIYWVLGKNLMHIILIFIFILVVAIWIYFNTGMVFEAAVSALENFRWNYAARSLVRMIEDPESSGTLGVRLDQIEMAFEGALLYIPFGVDLGRSILLESWLAETLHRYGLLGPIWFLCLSVYGGLSCLLASRRLRKRGVEATYLARGLAIWFILLPLTQTSSLMIETSKTMVLSVFILAISLTVSRIARWNMLRVPRLWRRFKVFRYPRSVKSDSTLICLSHL